MKRGGSRTMREIAESGSKAGEKRKKLAKTVKSRVWQDGSDGFLSPVHRRRKKTMVRRMTQSVSSPLHAGPSFF